MLVIALQSGTLRKQLEQILADEGVSRVTAAPFESPDSVLLREAGAVLVHDFPDPLRSIAWLDRAYDTRPAFTVFALLAPPASDTLHGLMRTPHRFVLSGMAVAGDDAPSALLQRLAEARNFGGRQDALRAICEGWRLDPVLRQLAQWALLHPRAATTMQGLLDATGIGRKAFVRHARAAGFDPPLRFLHALRVLEFTLLARDGCTITQAARQLGYGSTGTLRRHLRQLTGMAPGAARALGIPELTACVHTAANHSI